MGNCQGTPGVAPDGEEIELQHLDGKVERLYWSLTARQLMLKYPGTYVAQVTPPVHIIADLKVPLPAASCKLKLLPPDTNLQMGLNYRLVSFEDVLQEITEQQVMRSEGFGSNSKRVDSDQSDELSDKASSDGLGDGKEKSDSSVDGESKSPKTGDFGSMKPLMRSLTFSKSGTWRPVLQSISELAR